MNKKFFGISLISFLFSIAGIIISALLLKEDVLSTAKTIFEYFPATYGVTPSTSWQGAIILGVFVSVLEVISASVAFSNRFSTTWRTLAAVSLVLSVWFDNWTDVIFRSGYGLGDTKIAFISTVAFYTFGSEIAQSLSWLVFLSSWRSAVSDLLWGSAKFEAGVRSIGTEWKRFRYAASHKEFENLPKDNNQGNKWASGNRPIQTYSVSAQENKNKDDSQKKSWVSSLPHNRYNKGFKK